MKTIIKSNTKLFDLSVEEKYKFLRETIYEEIEHSHTGRLMICTRRAKQVAEMLGGDYDSLGKVQKDIFRSDIVFEQIYVEGGFLKYTLL